MAARRVCVADGDTRLHAVCHDLKDAGMAELLRYLSTSGCSLVHVDAAGARAATAAGRAVP